MTYDISYGSTNHDPWPWPASIVLTLVIACMLIVVIGVFFEGWRARAALFTVLALATACAVTPQVAADRSAHAARHQEKELRIERIARAWALNHADATYLLNNTYYADSQHGGRPADHEAFVTIDDEPVKAYLRMQGGRLLLIADDQAVPVVSR